MSREFKVGCFKFRDHKLKSFIACSMGLKWKAGPFMGRVHMVDGQTTNIIVAFDRSFDLSIELLAIKGSQP